MTLWQRPSLLVWHYTSSPVEYLAPLSPLYGRVDVHLIDDGPVPRSYVDSLKAVGFKVYGVIGDYRPILNLRWQSWYEACDFLVGQVARLGLGGAICNFEDYWEGADVATGGEWSADFVQEWRTRYPTKPLALNTYDECGGINLRAWADANARLYLQSYKGGVEPPAVIGGDVLWQFAKRYGWPTAKRAYWRPCLGVFKGSTGERVPIANQIAAMKDGRTVGFSAYYADGAFDVTNEYLIPLAQQAIAAGVAR